MASTVKIKSSDVAGKAPTPTDLEVGELAINFKDKLIYTKEPGGTVITLPECEACWGPGDCLHQDLGSVTGNVAIDTDAGRTVSMKQNGPISGFTITDNANPDLGWMRFKIEMDGTNVPDFSNFVGGWANTVPTTFAPGSEHLFTFHKIDGVWIGKYEGGPLSPAAPFKMTVRTAAPSETFTLLLEDVNAEVDWGDGSPASPIADVGPSSTDHVYTAVGTHQITITGKAKKISMNHHATAAKMIVSVDDWGHLNLESLNNGFAGCVNLVSVSAGDPIRGDIGSVGDLGYCFQGCVSLTSVGKLDVQKAAKQNIVGCFDGCTALTSFPDWNIDGAHSIKELCQGCTNLTTFPSFDAASCTNMDSAFNGCEKLTTMPLIDTSSVTNMFKTWNECKALTTFPLLNTSNVTDIQQAWRSCISLTSFPHIDTSNVREASGAWILCTFTHFPQLDMSECLSIGNSTYGGTWAVCENLVEFPDIKFPKVQSAVNAWLNNYKLVRFLGDLGFTDIQDISRAFANCRALRTIPLMNTGTAKTFGGLAKGCHEITTFPAIDLTGCNTGNTAVPAPYNPTGFESLVQSCPKLANWPAGILSGVTDSSWFAKAFQLTALTHAAKDRILSELDNGGMTDASIPGMKAHISFGTTIDFSTHAKTVLIPSLQAKGWIVD